MPSKMVVDRQELGRQVLAAMAVHAGEVAAGLGEVVGEAAGATGAMQRELRWRLEGRLAVLVAADEEHLDATAELTAARGRRDAAAGELYRLLVRVRRLAVGIYDAGAEGLLGLGGRVSQRPVVMLRQARRAVGRLVDPEVPRPEKLFAGTTVDEGEWVERLEPMIEALARAVDEVNVARRRTESTLRAKNEALAAYDLAFGRVARYLEALFHLAGLPELASRVRPRARRRPSPPASPPLVLPEDAPPHLGRLAEEPVERRDQRREVPLHLVGEEESGVVGVRAGEEGEVADVEGEEAAAVGGGGEELVLVRGVERHPVGRRAGDVVTALRERPLEGAERGVGVEVEPQARRRPLVRHRRRLVGRDAVLLGDPAGVPAPTRRRRPACARGSPCRAEPAPGCRRRAAAQRSASCLSWAGRFSE